MCYRNENILCGRHVPFWRGRTSSRGCGTKWDGDEMGHETNFSNKPHTAKTPVRVGVNLITLQARSVVRFNIYLAALTEL